MACSSRRRLLRLPRRADQRLGVVRIPISCRRPLASSAAPTQSASGIDMDADGEIGRRVPPQAANPSSVAKRAVRRQTPEVRAVCGNPASTDLCGGRSEMGVPTANAERALLKRCILRSSRRVGRCEFSARLFFHRPRSCRCSMPRSRAAAPYDRKSSVTNRSGAKAYFLRNYAGAGISCSM